MDRQVAQETKGSSDSSGCGAWLGEASPEGCLHTAVGPRWTSERGALLIREPRMTQVPLAGALVLPTSLRVFCALQSVCLLRTGFAFAYPGKQGLG